MSSITIAGITNLPPPEDRALVILQVDHNNQSYEWQRFIPLEYTNLDQWLADTTPSILAEIDTKELAWQNLDPKSREVTDPFTQQVLVVPIEKQEIVCPEIPDYYAKRRSEYPPLGDQLDAYWKGSNSPEYLLMQQKIAAVKQKYPKPF